MKIKSIIFNGRYILIAFSIMLIISIFKPYIIKWILTDNVTVTVEEPTDEEKSLVESSSGVNSVADDSAIKYYSIADKIDIEMGSTQYYFGILTAEGYFKMQVTKEVYNSYEIGNPVGAIKKNGEYVFSEGKEKKN